MPDNTMKTLFSFFGATWRATPLNRPAAAFRGLLASIALTAAAEAAPANLPDAFYTRAGLEEMPRIDYEALPVVNMIEAGARSDGSASINRVFDETISTLNDSGGGILYFPAGMYRFGPPPSGRRLYFNGKGLANIHLVGEGLNSVIVADCHRPDVRLMRIVKSKHLSIRDLAFRVRPYHDARTKNLGGTVLFSFVDNRHVQMIRVFSDQGYTAFWQKNRDIWVVDSDFRNSSADALKFDDCLDVVAAYNYMENVNEDAVSMLTMREQISARNRFLYNTAIGRAGQGRGIPISGWNHAVIGNWVECIGNAGLYFHEQGWADFRDLEAFSSGHEVRDNVFVRTNLIATPQNRRIGGKLGGGMVIMHNQQQHDITGNRVYGSAEDGICFAGHWLGVRARSLRLFGNEVAGSMEYGISFQVEKQDNYVRNVVVAGSRIYDNLGGSIYLQGTLRNLTFEDNLMDAPASVQSGNPERYAACFDDSGSLEGCRVADVEGPYHDNYLEARTADDETGWIDPPVIEPDGPVVNVRDAGAKGDGKTSDTAAFLSALKELPPDGGTLRIPAGDYLFKPVEGHDSLPFTRIRHHLLIKGRNNIHLVGEGARTRLFFTSRDHQGLRLLNVRKASIRNLTLAFPGTFPVRFSRSLLELSACEQVDVDNIRVRGSCGQGMLVDCSRAVHVRDCRVADSAEHGIKIDGGRQIFVRGCRVENSNDNGIFVMAIGSIGRVPQYVRIEGNTIAGSKEAHGIALGQGGRPVIVRRNRVQNAFQAGIAVYSVNAAYPDRVIDISGNTLTGCAAGRPAIHHGAISIASLGHHALPEVPLEIRVTDNEIRDTPENGIWVDHNKRLTRLTVRGNTFDDIDGEPVFLGPGQRDVIEELVLDQ